MYWSYDAMQRDFDRIQELYNTPPEDDYDVFDEEEDDEEDEDLFDEEDEKCLISSL